jgi:hypothetical protein
VKGVSVLVAVGRVYVETEGPLRQHLSDHSDDRCTAAHLFGWRSTTTFREVLGQLLFSARKAEEVRLEVHQSTCRVFKNPMTAVFRSQNPISFNCAKPRHHRGKVIVAFLRNPPQRRACGCHGCLPEGPKIIQMTRFAIFCDSLTLCIPLKVTKPPQIAMLPPQCTRAHPHPTQRCSRSQYTSLLDAS